MNYKNISSNIKSFINTPMFKVIYIISLVLTFCILLGTKQSLPELSYFELYYVLLTNPSFILFNYFLISLIASISFFYNINKRYSYIIRLKSKKEYMIYLLKNIWVINIFIFIIITLSCLILLNLFGNNFSLSMFANYNILNIIYIIYILVRLLLLCGLLSVISVLFLLLINNKIVIIANLLLYGMIKEQPIRFNLRESLRDFTFWIGNYVIPDIYSSFLLDICCTSLFLIIIIIIIIIIFNVALRNMKQVGD